MGLFDFWKKKTPPPTQVTQQEQEQKRKLNQEVFTDSEGN